MTEGYSGKSLSQKLGIKPGDTILAIDPPANYAALLAPLPVGAVISGAASAPDIVHAFVTSRAIVDTAATRLVTLARAGGALWTKKTSALFVDLTEDGIREAVLPTGWVDVKVCAVDADWSGLKFLRRRTV